MQAMTSKISKVHGSPHQLKSRNSELDKLGFEIIEIEIVASCCFPTTCGHYQSGEKLMS